MEKNEFVCVFIDWQLTGFEIKILTVFKNLNIFIIISEINQKGGAHGASLSQDLFN